MPPPSIDEPHTSGPLPGDEVPQDYHQQLTDVEARFADIMRASARLRIDVKALTKQVLSNKSILNRLMTDDILLTIFHAMVLVRNHCGPYPWVLAAVCRRWRSICLDSPTLWSQLRLGSMHHCDIDKYSVAAVSRTLLQLERSQAAPLHIIIDAPVCACPSQVSIFQAVIARSRRWKSVLLCMPNRKYWRQEETDALQALLPANSDFTGLEKIYWQPDASGFSSGYLPVLPFSDCSHLTSLHDLSLKGFGLHFSDRDLGAKIPWEQLTHLRIGSSDSHRELLLTLSTCQNLIQLEVTLSCGKWEEVDIEEGSIVLPRLQIISIYVDEDNVNILSYGPDWENLEYGPVPVFPYLRLPSLNVLKVGDFEREGLLGVVIDLIERSSCSESLLDLTVFSVKGVFVEDLSPLLQKTPKIRYLTLGHVWSQKPHTAGSNQVMRCLILEDNKPTTSWLCPHLKELHLAGMDPDPMVLVLMMDSRVGRGRVNATRHAHLERVIWNYDKDQEGYNFCKDLLEQHYSDTSIKLELSRDKSPLQFGY